MQPLKFDKDVKAWAFFDKKLLIEKAKERLAILKNCNCKEFQELELIIKTRGSKIY